MVPLVKSGVVVGSCSVVLRRLTMERGGQINARKLLFVMNKDELSGDGAASVCGRLAAFVRERGISAALVLRSGYVVLVSASAIRFNGGCATMRALLDLSSDISRVTTYRDLPYRFLQDQFADGLELADVLYSHGERFSKDNMAKIAKVGVERMMRAEENEHILACDHNGVLDDGSVAVENSRRAYDGRKHCELLIKSREMRKRDHSGEIVVTLEHRERRASTGAYVPTGRFPPVEIRIDALLDNVREKLKHTYVYSGGSNFGKSYAFASSEFSEKYNSYTLPDIKNWCTVPEDAQFIVIDEIGIDRKLDIFALKAFTAGDASGAAAPIKSYGASYVPRPDMQLILLSNKSIYDVYGTWHAKLQRRFMSRDTIEQLESRFTIYRLDGDVAQDRTRCTLPSEWTDDEFDREIDALFVPPSKTRMLARGVNSRVEILLNIMRVAHELWCAAVCQDAPHRFAYYMTTRKTTHFPTERVTMEDALTAVRFERWDAVGEACVERRSSYVGGYRHGANDVERELGLY